MNNIAKLFSEIAIALINILFVCVKLVGLLLFWKILIIYMLITFFLGNKNTLHLNINRE